jgi:hypothetical protein
MYPEHASARCRNAQPSVDDFERLKNRLITSEGYAVGSLSGHVQEYTYLMVCSECKHHPIAHVRFILVLLVCLPTPDVPLTCFLSTPSVRISAHTLCDACVLRPWPGLARKGITTRWSVLWLLQHRRM